MITDFDAAPMSTDEVQPLFGFARFNWLGAEVIAGSFVFGFLEGCRIAGNAYYRLDMREIDIERIYRA